MEFYKYVNETDREVKTRKIRACHKNAHLKQSYFFYILKGICLS